MLHSRKRNAWFLKRLLFLALLSYILITIMLTAWRIHSEYARAYDAVEQQLQGMQVWVETMLASPLHNDPQSIEVWMPALVDSELIHGVGIIPRDDVSFVYQAGIIPDVHEQTSVTALQDMPWWNSWSIKQWPQHFSYLFIAPQHGERVVFYSTTEMLRDEITDELWHILATICITSLWLCGGVFALLWFCMHGPLRRLESAVMKNDFDKHVNRLCKHNNEMGRIAQRFMFLKEQLNKKEKHILAWQEYGLSLIHI